MSIWIKNDKGETVLAPHSYEKTLVGISRLVVWIEGTNTELSFTTEHRGFGIAGGSIWTNNGILLKKEDLIELVSKMKEGSELRIAYPDQYVSTDYRRHNNEKTIQEEFREDNDKIQISPNSFAPSEIVRKWVETGDKNIHPDYLEYCKSKLNL